jgi:hypothetical protein
MRGDALLRDVWLWVGLYARHELSESGIAPDPHNTKRPSDLVSVIARCAKRAVAIQPLDGLRALSLSKRLVCFVVPLCGSRRNDSLFRDDGIMRPGS